MPRLATTTGDASLEGHGAIRRIRHRKQNGRYGDDERQAEDAAEDDPPYVPSAHLAVAKFKLKCYRLCASFSSSPTIASPISLVLTILQPSDLMSAVRSPLARAAAIA